MDHSENEATRKTGDLKRKSYSKPRLQVYGDLRTITQGSGNPSPTASDSPVQHNKSQ